MYYMYNHNKHLYIRQSPAYITNFFYLYNKQNNA